MVWLVAGTGTTVLCVVMVQKLILSVVVFGKGKRPREAEQGGGNNKRHNGGRNHGQHGGGGNSGGNRGGATNGVHIPQDEFEARKRHGVCTHCGRDGHYGNKCRNGKSLVPSFAGRS